MPHTFWQNHLVPAYRGVLNHPLYQYLATSLFHYLYYYGGRSATVWEATTWLGVPVWKCPLDLWIYQELLYEVQADIIIETGTAHGGSALYLASLCDLIGRGRVLTVDIEPRPNRPRHSRIEYITGSSIDPEIVSYLAQQKQPDDTVLAILDSDHRMQHVFREMQVYGALVSPGSYLIVEDTNINGHPVLRGYGPGPMEAVQEFLRQNSEFRADRRREKFYLTFNPKGYLRKLGNLAQDQQAPQRLGPAGLITA